MRNKRFQQGFLSDPENNGGPFARGSFAAVAIGGTVALGAAGGAMSAAGANRGGREARDWSNDRTFEGMNRLGGTAFGNSYYGQFSPDGATGYISPADQRRGIDAFTQAQGGPAVQQMRDLANATSQRQTGDLQNFDRTSGNLMAQSAGNQGLAQNWGVGQANMIRGDAARNLNANNQRTQASLAASGFGNSTVGAAQMGENARNSQRETQRSLMDLSNNQIDRQMGARQATIGLGAQQQGARNSMEDAFLSRDINMRQAPINTMLGVQQGSVMNPWLGTNTALYYPGASPIGSALSGAGKSLGAIVGMGMGG